MKACGCVTETCFVCENHTDSLKHQEHLYVVEVDGKCELMVSNERNGLEPLDKETAKKLADIYNSGQYDV
jgi:tRNA G18 (ribose-2'-O)-methylase SpoU|tara:strand:+ start:423 stop:632 length:210 start_codon:yes stop_codon:yes gene_type:complete